MTCAKCGEPMVVQIETREFTYYACRLNGHPLRVEHPVEKPAPGVRRCGWCENSKVGPCAKHGGLTGVARRIAHNKLRYTQCSVGG